MARPTNDRIIGVLLVGLGVLGVLWIRCVWLQVVMASRYTAIVENQHEAIGRLRARRRAIYDRNERPLALSVLAPSVFANARHVVAKRDVAVQLARVVDRDPQRIQQRL